MGASTAHPVNTTVEAGLPNITGTFTVRKSSDPSQAKYGPIVNGEGAFVLESGKSEGFGSPVEIPHNDIFGGDYAKIDASRSSPVYGASDTVQPPAYCVYIWKRIE